MADETPVQRKRRRRVISVGETIALLALIVSGLGLWLTWQDRGKKGPTEVIEKRAPVPLVLRGTVEEDGKQLLIEPVESGHTLQSLSITVAASGTVIDVGGDGALSSRAIESALNLTDREEGPVRVKVRTTARYVEAGVEKSAAGPYTIVCRWKGGGILSGKQLRIVSFSRG